MEIELKYLLSKPELESEIFACPEVKKYAVGQSEKVTPMRAVYYEALDEKVTRIRKEGDEFVLTQKWGGSTDGALHVRNEVNTKVEGFSYAEERGWKEEFAINVIRREIILDTGLSKSVLSVDRGEIVAPNGKTEAVLEMEIELLEGEISDMVSLGERIAERFGLVKGEVSKYARGIKLAQY